jgi:hypothetical protein
VKRLDCVEFYELYGTNNRANEFGDIDYETGARVTATIEKPPAYGIDIPDWSEEDPASLESWFGPGGFVEPLRKIVLSNCRELERAKALVEGVKITESRLDDLAHVHPNYVQFIIDGLGGRKARENNVIQTMRAGS